jgi:hypothetical protein
MSWRRILAIALPVVLVAVSLSFAATALGQNDRDGRFRARLDGYHETPSSISTTGQGDFEARLNNGGMVLDFTLRYSALEGGAVSGAHIHLGQLRTGGGVIAFLCGGGGKPACPAAATVNGTVTPADVRDVTGQGIAAGEFGELIRAMRQGATYVNVHTAVYPSGEIRGQIRGKGDRGRDD